MAKFLLVLAQFTRSVLGKKNIPCLHCFAKTSISSRLHSLDFKSFLPVLGDRQNYVTRLISCFVHTIRVTLFNQCLFATYTFLGGFFSVFIIFSLETAVQDCC